MPFARVLGRVPALAAVMVAAIVWIILLAPFAELLSQVSFHTIRQSLDQPPGYSPIWTSLEASSIALGAMIVLGTPLAYLLARNRLKAPRLVEAGIVIPLLMPPLVIGLLLIFLIGQAGPVGRVVQGLDPNVFGVNTFFALVVAEFFEAAPYFILAATAAFATVDTRLEHDAQLLGDRPLNAFRKVTVPLAAPGLAAGLSIAWARAMGAFGAVLIVAYYPPGLPITIDETFTEFGLSHALVFALLLIVAALPFPVLALLWLARARARRADTVAA
jgi:molybdate/tungstate transport system permease protein